MNPDAAQQAKAAREHARNAFLRAVDQGIEVRRLAGKMQDHARRNHFGEGLEALWTRGKRT